VKTLSCIDKAGNATAFEYWFSEDTLRGEWQFFVAEEPPRSTAEPFELAVKEIDATTVQVVMMNNHGRPCYVGKGIPDALLPVVKLEVQKDVQSSPTAGGGNTYRTPAATKVWKRLVAKGIATYDVVTDIFTLM
jgi:hypothetical protein